MSLLPPSTKVDLAGKILVVPVVSTANVSQLAVDLISATFSLERIATLDPSHCIPVVGAREDGLPGITTPLECNVVFGKPGFNIVVTQQRSPVLVTQKQEFVEALFQFIQASKFSAVLFLSGVDSINRNDSQMFTPTFQIRRPNTPSLEDSPLHLLQKLPIPVFRSSTFVIGGTGEDQSEMPFIPGGGLTRRILSSLPENWSTPTGSLLQFVMEGDNRADATLLASVVAKVTEIDSQISEWKQPSTWKVGLFGSPHEQDLYG
ncbi:hypothetical protein FA15DRAFT_593721 [Coprinopsis marcescibilis]|uniref:Proteasome assembly chaperone 2 n=1 Tax=Coprinopsis marcescibilis TaxID=230819 RepID=A0A5C3KTB5_COPMA|nr:hypothetical protein FA15DRAFT_593721 [Coprinopsis marcescibilis]